MRIFNRYLSIYDLVLVMGDLAVAFAAMVLVRIVIFHFEMSVHPQWVLLVLQSLAVTVILVLSFYYSDLYAIDQTLSLRELLLRLMNGVGLTSILIGVVSYPIPEFGKTLYASEMLLLIFGLCCWRMGFMRVIERAGIHARVLVVGSQAIGRLVAEELLRQKKLGMQVVGFLGDTPGQLTLSYGNPIKVSVPVYKSSALVTLFEEKGVNRILLTGAESCSDVLGSDLVNLRAQGVAIEDCHSFYERLVSKIALADLSPDWLIRSKGFRRDPVIMFTKRVIDFAVAVVGLIVTAPVTLLAAVAIKFDSRGPIFYRQERVGRNGKNFTIYKFRSMTDGAEADGGPVWATVNDPRVTQIGRILRKLRIDEIPQMVNVFKGEMSLVGPRPERPFFVQKLTKNIPYYALRHSIVPGITGWAQISYPYGESEADAVEKLQYDLYYIKNMSALFDLQILFESLKVVLLGRGAR